MVKCARCGKVINTETDVLVYDGKRIFVNACETILGDGDYKCELHKFCPTCTKSYIKWLENGRSIEKCK